MAAIATATAEVAATMVAAAEVAAAMVVATTMVTAGIPNPVIYGHVALAAPPTPVGARGHDQHGSEKDD